MREKPHDRHDNGTLAEPYVSCPRTGSRDVVFVLRAVWEGCKQLLQLIPGASLEGPL